jgi:uncharacterized protein YutE (UPF0331/DUF86 family)
VDRERILSKIAELEGYLEELRTILPKDFEEFQKIEKKRACERLLQIAIEAVMDICYLLVRDLRLGLPSDEEDILDKIEEAGIIQGELQETLRKMRGFRNILVHEYGRVDDWIVYQMTTQGFESFDRFRKTVLRFLYSG